MNSPGNSNATNANTAAAAAAEALNSYEDLKTRRAWDFAISPVKSLPMQAFMLYMSGGGVQIFSMGIVAMLLLSPFKNLSCMNEGTSCFPASCIKLFSLHNYGALSVACWLPCKHCYLLPQSPVPPRITHSLICFPSPLTITFC